MRDHRRIKQEIHDRIVDIETGEVKYEQQHITYKIKSEPDFVKVYLKDLLYLFGLAKYNIGVLLWMMQHVTYASDQYGLCTALNSTLKKDMMKALGIKHQGTIDNILSELAKKDVIQRVGRGVYRLNPYLFGRGDWHDITKIRMMVEYTIDGKTIEGELQKESQKRLNADQQQNEQLAEAKDERAANTNSTESLQID